MARMIIGRSLALVCAGAACSAYAVGIVSDSGTSISVKNQALANLRAGNFTTNTAGVGGLNNSGHIRFFGGKLC